MRVLVLTDTKINKADAQRIKKKLKNFYQALDITFSMDLHYEDHSGLVFENYYNDDKGQNRGIAKSYLKKRAQAIQKRYNRKYDSVMFWVHKNNWTPIEDRIAGWNISQEYGGMENQQCMFDPQDPDWVNFSVLYHEMMHAYDQFIFRMTGERIEPIVKVSDWDRQVVHGKSPRFRYIGHHDGRENREALEDISHLLNRAIARRVRQHALHISTLEKLIETYRALINRITQKDQYYKVIN